MEINLTKVVGSLSEQRCRAYGSQEKEQLAVYLWNNELSKCFYTSLNFFEVVLRNSLYQAIFYASENPFWFKDSHTLKNIEKDMVSDVLTKLQKKHHSETESDFIASLPFGFWTNLLDKRYEGIFWPRLLKPVFPYMPRSLRTQKLISKRLNKIRGLRNRIFHHERIWHMQNLHNIHAEIMEALAWICQDGFHFCSLVNDFNKIHQLGAGEYLTLVERASAKDVEIVSA